MFRKKLAKMDLDKMLRHVNNLNDYITVTQEVSKHAVNNTKVQFNMSTVLLLKKVKSLEIEYFNKCEGNGAALVLFERMVEQQPPSKTWGLLGKELVSLLQYWLDAIRKHLIRHNQHWWTFLKVLLKFIKIIRTKDRSLPDVLVEGTTECLLDLATSSQPDILQRLEILFCLNLCGAESSREIRFALKDKFEGYFDKLASLVVGCGHLGLSLSALEALLRWLLRRRAGPARAAAAQRWFPPHACAKPARELFVMRTWQDFFQDARDFLNACNDASQLVTSVVCRKVSVGSVVVVAGTEKRRTWMDVNTGNKSLSVVLDPRLLEAMGVKDVTSWEMLAVAEEEVVSMQLYRESSVCLEVRTSECVLLRPAAAAAGPGPVRLVLSSGCDLHRLDRALRDVFGTKYQVLLDLDKPISPSPQECREHSQIIPSSLEEDTRFSHPIDVQRRKHSGFIVRSRNPVAWPSPSTASTSSLAQLHEKLAALPHYKFDKEAVHVCALPELSTVTEISETDDRQSLLSSETLKITRHIGVCQKNFRKSERNSQSDGEVHTKPNVSRYLSPVEKVDEHSTNCLVVATIGSADESVINDTLERLTKNKDFRSDNIVNLLVQEALQKDLNERDLLDSGINTDDNAKKTQNLNEINSEAIENTPVEPQNVLATVCNKGNEKTCTVISNTTTDESNDVVCETPKNFVNVRKRTLRKVIKEKDIPEESEKQLFDVNAMEEFFSQHIAENIRGEVLISPTLARKINETSSESEPFEDCLLIHQDNNVNVEQIEQDIEEKEKSTELLNQNSKDEEIDTIDIASNITHNQNPPDLVPLADISNMDNIVSEKENVKPQTRAKKPIKLKYTAKKTPKATKSRTNTKKFNRKLELEHAPDKSPIKKSTEDIDEVQSDVKIPDNGNPVKSPENNSPTNKSVDSDTPLIRRKRKLYSPKYENIDSEKIDDNDSKNFKATKIQTPKFNSTCYKEIEMERKKRIRQPRVRKSRKSSGKADTPSPRTKKKNDIFDQLKETIECSVTVCTDKKTEKDAAIYNFTDDSEDEDFKKKKIEVQKRISSTTIASGDSAMSTRHGRTVNRVNYNENKSSDETVKNSAPKPKRVVRRKRTPRTRLLKPVNELVDEKMRNAVPFEPNSSIIVDKPAVATEEPELLLNVNPEMELIPDEKVIEVIDNTDKNTKKKHKKAEILSLKKEKTLQTNALQVEHDNDDRTTSPLPGLVIETMPDKVDDANDSVSLNMLLKLKKMHQDGTDEFINETNTTQNLLSDVERINYSPIPINITDEFNKLANDDSKADDTTNSAKSSKTKKKQTKKATEILKVKKEVADKMRKQEQKTEEVINLSDTKSEKSIATIGKSPITAHGDFDEAPPDSELLTQKLKPRDLEIEYLNQSMQEYYYNLRDEVINFPKEKPRRKSNDSNKTVERNISEEKSPVVSIQRLSFDDIAKWLPSPRNSDTDSRCTENPVSERKGTKTSTPNIEAPSKESLDEEFNFTIPKVQKVTEISQEVNDSIIRRSKRVKTKPLLLEDKNNENALSWNSGGDILRHNTSKWLRSHGDNPEIDSSETSTNKVTEKYKTHPITDEKVKKNKKSKNCFEEKTSRQSMISPIKLFDEFCDVERQKSPILRQKSLSRDKSSVSRQESLTTRQQSVNRKQELSSDEEVSNILSNKKKAKANKKDLNHLKVKKNNNSSSETKRSSPNKREYTPKRKSDSPEVGYAKRSKTEDFQVTMSESGPSATSVNEWFRRNMPASTAQSIDTSLRDSIESVMEKLDTTLVEIHQSTSKKFIDMFVDAQRQLAGLRRERRAALRAAAADILAQLVGVIDDKFADLDRKSEELHSAFTARLKTQAAALVREDCGRKHALVALLREDLHATLARHRGGRGEK